MHLLLLLLSPLPHPACSLCQSYRDSRLGNWQSSVLFDVGLGPPPPTASWTVPRPVRLHIHSSNLPPFTHSVKQSRSHSFLLHSPPSPPARTGCTIAPIFPRAIHISTGDSKAGPHAPHSTCCIASLSSTLHKDFGRELSVGTRSIWYVVTCSFNSSVLKSLHHEMLPWGIRSTTLTIPLDCHETGPDIPVPPLTLCQLPACISFDNDYEVCNLNHSQCPITSTLLDFPLRVRPISLTRMEASHCCGPLQEWELQDKIETGIYRVQAHGQSRC